MKSGISTVGIGSDYIRWMCNTMFCGCNSLEPMCSDDWLLVEIWRRQTLKVTKADTTELSQSLNRMLATQLEETACISQADQCWSCIRHLYTAGSGASFFVGIGERGQGANSRHLSREGAVLLRHSCKVSKQVSIARTHKLCLRENMKPKNKPICKS